MSYQHHPPLSLQRGERGTPTPRSCFAAECRTRNVSAKNVLEAQTSSTANYLDENPSTIPLTLASNSHFPGTKTLLLTSELLPNLSKELRATFCQTWLHKLFQNYPQLDCPCFKQISILWSQTGSSTTLSHRKRSTSVIEPTEGT